MPPHAKNPTKKVPPKKGSAKVPTKPKKALGSAKTTAKKSGSKKAKKCAGSGFSGVKKPFKFKSGCISLKD